MVNRKYLVVLAYTLFAVANARVCASALISDLDLSAVFESERSSEFSSNSTQKSEMILTPELNATIAGTTRLIIKARLRGDANNKLAPGQTPQSNRSNYSKRAVINHHIDIELREAFIDTDIGSTFLRIGKQQIVWGQADGLKVLDVINPQSFREFILDDFEDSRIPLWSLNAEIPIKNTLMQIIWVPDNTYDDIPNVAAAYTFTSPQLIPSIPTGTNVEFTQLKRRNRFLVDSDIGVKLSAFIGGWDLSLNYFYHYFDRPVIRQEVSENSVKVLQNYERTHLVGATFSNVFGDFTLRGEAGYSSDRYFVTNTPLSKKGVQATSEFSYVLGLDYQGWRNWFVSAQVFQSIVSNKDSRMIRDTSESSTTLLIRRDLMNETLLAEVLVIHNLNLSDGLIQGSIKYNWRSNIQLKAGVDLFYGKSAGLFGQFNNKDRVSIGIEIGL